MIIFIIIFLSIFLIGLGLGILVTISYYERERIKQLEQNFYSIYNGFEKDLGMKRSTIETMFNDRTQEIKGLMDSTRHDIEEIETTGRTIAERSSHCTGTSHRKNCQKWRYKQQQ
jgi:hypothetical protein